MRVRLSFGDPATKQWIHKLRLPAIFLGPLLVALLSWPFVLWTELVVSRNNIHSDTDLVAVYLFAAQLVTMVVPRFKCSDGGFSG